MRNLTHGVVGMDHDTGAYMPDPKCFVTDDQNDHFFIGELSQSEMSHSELFFRLSVDDGHMKHVKTPIGKA